MFIALLSAVWSGLVEGKGESIPEEAAAAGGSGEALGMFQDLPGTGGRDL